MERAGRRLERGEQSVPSQSKSAFDHISERRLRPWKGEEEVRAAWVSGLEAELGIIIDMERARKDSSYNNVIIEFKSPGLFNGSKDSSAFRNAANDRLLPYIHRDAQRTGIAPENYIGIAIDGDHICFGRVVDGGLKADHLLPFSKFSVEIVLDAIRSETRRAVCVDNLIADFGHRSIGGHSLMQAMSDALARVLNSSKHRKVSMLFEEWRTLYGQVADMSVLQAAEMTKDMAFDWKGDIKDAMSGRLFVIHSYNSLLIKLLAAEIVSSHGLSTVEQPAQAMAALLDDVGLVERLSQDIELGGIFSGAGIKGFVEEAIFSWYLDMARDPAFSKPIVEGLRQVLALLSLYRTDQLDRTRDVLRDLYQSLVPGKLRQSLGEFYTPDWLVDFTIDRAADGPWLSKRVLDPTCGSGAFLIAMVRLMRGEATSKGWEPSVVLDHLCSSVWGFDLNPLAVQTSRVNFLMEIADLLRLAPGHTVEVPVLLADAIYSPAPMPETGQDVVRYKFGSQTAKLDIHLPAVLASDRQRLDRVFEVMAESVEGNFEFAHAANRLISTNLMTSKEGKAWGEPLKITYDQVLALHRLSWNGIWFRIVRNFFWSVTAGRFDCIVGNPPWVRWSKLPLAYRERVKPTCESYGIFSENKRHGGNELDISAMITYTTADKWLADGGRLAFVITGTIFKNPSSSGFRDFRITTNENASVHLAPVSVDDFKAVKPFPDAANHSVVAIFDKSNRAGRYPVDYRIWSKAHGHRTAISAQEPLKAVLKRLTSVAMQATPVGAPGSPWAVLAPGRHKALKSIAGKCSWVDGRKGITTDLNGVYFVPILADNGSLVQVRSQPNAGKKDIGLPRAAWVEPTWLFPLIKGAGNFEPCYLKLDAPDYPEERLYAFVPNQGISSEDYSDCSVAINRSALKQTKAWFKNYTRLLDNRSTFRRQMQGAPNFAVYNVGTYTFQRWKVIWPEMSSRFYAALAGSREVPTIGSRPYVPDHKIYFAAFDDKDEAAYLCGMLNSPMVREWVESHNVSIQVGNIFKHLNLPPWDKRNKAHQKLAALVIASHEEHESAPRLKLLAKIEALGDAILGD